MIATHFGAFLLIVGILFGLYTLPGIFEIEAKAKKERAQITGTVIFLLCLSFIFIVGSAGIFLFSGIIK